MSLDNKVLWGSSWFGKRAVDEVGEPLSSEVA